MLTGSLEGNVIPPKLGLIDIAPAKVTVYILLHSRNVFIGY